MKISDCFGLIECREPGRIVGDIWPTRTADVWSDVRAFGMVCKAIGYLTPLVKRVIVVVTPGNRLWLKQFNDYHPGRILPGLAGNMLTGHALADVAKCRLFVQCAEEAADMCGSDTVYVDLESAIEGYLKGEIDLNLAAVTACIRQTFGGSRVKFIWYHPERVWYYLERSLALLNAFLAAIDLGDSFAPGFASGRSTDGDTSGRIWTETTLGHRNIHEQLLIRPENTKWHTAASALAFIKKHSIAAPYVFNFSAAQCARDAKEFAALAAQQQETETMAISSRRIVGRFALGFRKMLITQPVAPAPAYLELGPVTWANNTNGGGGEPRPLRQDGNKAIARVKLPASSLPYWIIPEIGIGELYGSHALEGTNGHECQAMGAPWNDGELGPLTIKKRSITEPKLIQPSETDVWTDFEVPMLGEVGPDNIFVVNLHPYLIQAS